MTLPAWLSFRPLVLARPAAATPGTHVLNFFIQNRQQNQWSAQAVASSVDTFYKGTSAAMSQCQVANSVFSVNTCCVATPPAECLASVTLSKVLKAVNHFGSGLARAATTTEVSDTIDAGNPVAVRLDLNAGGTGFCVIYGYTSPTSSAFIWYVADPANGYSLMNSSAFPGSYFGGATWNYTVLTRA